MNLRASLLAVIVLGTSCAIDDGVDDSEPAAQATQAVGGGSCQEWMCGTNSPEIANFGFWDMGQPPLDRSAPGAANRVGIQIVAFIKPTGSSTYAYYVPQVITGKLYGFPYPTNVAPYNVLLQGQALVGGYFMLTMPSGYFQLWVREVSTVRSWAQPVGPVAVPLSLETYKLDWTNFGDVDHPHNVCNKAGQLRDELGMNGKLAFHTLLFEGDRIDADHKRVSGVDIKWFNLGCAASTLAKMALTGHTEAAKRANTFSTTLMERQAMLKMLTADYCGDFGDGTPYTVQGQPLNWADDKGTMKMIAPNATPPRPVHREARWGAGGAVCLDYPRVDVNWTPLGEATFDNLAAGNSVYEQVIANCPRVIPHCSGTPLGLDGAHLITATEPHHKPVP